MYEVQEIVRATDSDGAEYDHIFVAYDRTDYPLSDVPAVDVLERIMDEVHDKYDDNDDEEASNWGQVIALAETYGIYDITESIAVTKTAF